MKTFILASKNKHKAEEINKILGDGFKVITQEDAGFGDIDVIEDGKTFEENSIKKAEAIMKASNMPTIADDSGLCVDALDGAPGIYSARYAGEGASDQDKINKLLENLSDIPDEKRTACFVCVVSLSYPDKETLTFRGECKGRISKAPSGSGGFGYDPIFYLDEYKCTMADVGEKTKNKISHRANALKKFAEYVKNN